MGMPGMTILTMTNFLRMIDNWRLRVSGVSENKRTTKCCRHLLGVESMIR